MRDIAKSVSAQLQKSAQSQHLTLKILVLEYIMVQNITPCYYVKSRYSHVCTFMFNESLPTSDIYASCYLDLDLV